MWQEATFNPEEIEKEFTWAEAMGMNTMRSFLHDLLWQQDAAGFHKRIDRFLAIASRHHIRPMFVLFDSCWDPLPHLGLQHPPIPGVHNSGWVQSPGAKALGDANQNPRLKTSVQSGRGAFAPNTWRVPWAARLTRCCRSPSRSASGPSIGGSSPAKRKPIYRGTPGSIPTFSASRRCGFTRCCVQTEPPIDRQRWI